jgi:hypothetical protein
MKYYSDLESYSFTEDDKACWSSTAWLGFNTRSLRVGFVVDEVDLGQISSEYFCVLCHQTPHFPLC